MVPTVSVSSLFLPIVLSAVIVFVASSLVHMVLPYHKSDYHSLPNEDEALQVLRRAPAGDYIAPRPASMAGMKDPAFVDKMKKGPIVVMTLMPGRAPSMGKQLTLWFVYLLLVSFFAAYIAGRAVGVGTDYLQVFRFVGATAFLAYSFALLQNSIWWGKSWRTTALSMFDGLIYALLTAGTFGWLWPKM